jgi:hypothetical protein
MTGPARLAAEYAGLALHLDGKEAPRAPHLNSCMSMLASILEINVSLSFFK